jgi:hypothetical protein
MSRFARLRRRGMKTKTSFQDFSLCWTRIAFGLRKLSYISLFDTAIRFGCKMDAVSQSFNFCRVIFWVGAKEKDVVTDI